VGEENFFLFGLRTEEVQKLKQTKYNPKEYYLSDIELRECLDSILSGHFSHGDNNLFKPIVDSLMNYDPYMLMADYRHYINCQQRVSNAFLDQDNWTRMSILNVARSGKISSDRTIQEYCKEFGTLHRWRCSCHPIMPPQQTTRSSSFERKDRFNLKKLQGDQF